MAQEDGLSFLKDLIDRQIPSVVDTPAKVRLWLGQIQPLFQLLTHTRVADSNVLEQQVATICSFVQGIGCSRMKRLFDFVLDLLNVWLTLPMAEMDEYGISACELSLSVLVTMIDCNTSNIIDDNYSQIVERFSSQVQFAQDSPNAFLKRQARKHLQYLWTRLGVGHSLNEDEEGKTAPGARAEFVMKEDLPGLLSADGPRHDNDHADICNIRILPTYEEITSKRYEYLPTTDPSLFHTPGIRGRLDREFRLLREDTVGQLRDAVSLQLNVMRDNSRKQNRENRSAIRTYAYEDAEVTGVDFDKNNNMEMVIRFRQPTGKKSAQQRRDWWGNSRRLQPGGLVCIVSEDGSVLFCVVADSTIAAHDQNREIEVYGGAQRPLNKPSLAGDDVFAYVHLRLVETYEKDLRQVLEWFLEESLMQQRCLVEFPGVLLPSFQHTLIALQRMSKRSNIPFEDLLVSTEQTSDSGVKMVNPPQYTTKPGFSFDLSCLVDDEAVLHHSPREPLEPQELSSHSTLDFTQSTALLNTLSRELALIQGPPGTGKSYTGEKLIKALLANRDEANLGPILCVCYTNHALDQLLVHLQREDVSIIRIGSRSKVEELESVNLRSVAQSARRTREEWSSINEQKSVINELAASIMHSIKDLSSCRSLKLLQEYLSEFHPQHHDALFEQDEEGYVPVRRDQGKLLDQWLRGGGLDDFHPRDVEVLIEVPLWDMTRSERSLLYDFWMRELSDPLIADIIEKYSEYEEAKAEREKVLHDVDLRCLHEADVVGVTTTGLARNLDFLQKLRCKVMLCEEAGEVLEAHTLTVLLPSVEHAILIGDHLQLRPQIANYDLQSASRRGARYSFDVSLFERLINPLHKTGPSLPFETLETQRRMHPSVSELIRSTLYPSLDDGGSVASYPEVYGMKRRLFWLHHESPEDQETQVDPISTSRTNAFEVAMTVSLVQHLVRQGSYGPDDIAVITPYLAQLMQLRREMGKLFEISVGERDLDEIEAFEADMSEDDGMIPQLRKPSAIKRTLLKSTRLATVDNFQGEEAKVVVISLVRSNDANRCGFLSTSNRINVLLSRAQHGMYLIGNANTYRSVDMWAKVLEILQRDGNVGEQLELQCERAVFVANLPRYKPLTRLQVRAIRTPHY
ncbi:formate dehydrogenase (NAD+) [Hypoxylon texense]